MALEIGGLLSQAFSGGADVSLAELQDAFSDLVPFKSDDLLGNAGLLNAHIEKHGLTLDPPLVTGNLSTRRILKCRSINHIDQKLEELISNGESSRVEFKGSLFTNLSRLDHDGSYTRSEEVIHSSLKTLCAFGNTDGGQLLIGVEDNGKIRGIETDLRTIGKERDAWENELRSLVAGRFRDGVLSNTFLAVSYYERNELTVACVNCVKRSGPVFLKHPKDARHEFFVRQGNRSTSLDIPDVLDYLASIR